MDFHYNNMEEVKRTSQQAVLYGKNENEVTDLMERFWVSAEQFPNSKCKIYRQQRMYSEAGAGHCLLTLRQVADLEGRSIRRYVPKLHEYLDNEYYFLFIDIDDLKGMGEKNLVTYNEMIELVSKFKSVDFTEVYVRPSTSTEKKPWKFHLYIRTRMPYYYREVVEGERFRRKREHSNIPSEEEMTWKFLKAFMEYFPDFFTTHQFAKVDTALFSIHQCFHSAPANDLKDVSRSVLPGMVIGKIPTIGRKYDPYHDVPLKYLCENPYPCNASMRYKSWGLTLLPTSFDVSLPSQKVRYTEKRVQDGRRRNFAQKLAKDLWVAVHFNLQEYPEYAEPYDRERLFKFVMSEVYAGADMSGACLEAICDRAWFGIDSMDKDRRSVSQIIEDEYAQTVEYGENGKITKDPYKIKHLNRTSHEHVGKVIEELKTTGVIKRGRLTVQGAELKRILAEKHVSQQALLNHGIKAKVRRRQRSDKGRNRRKRSLLFDYAYLCNRDLDGRLVVPSDMAKSDQFRKFCSRNKLPYVSSSRPCDDPLDIPFVVDLPQDAISDASWALDELE